MNAIWVLTNKHSMTCDEAKMVCRARARQYTAEYAQVIEAVKIRHDLCPDAKFLLGVQQFGISGNVVWGLQCPRYHADRMLNAAQLEMAKAVWADEKTARSKCNQRKAEAVNRTSEHADNQTDGTVIAKDTTHDNITSIRTVAALGTEVLNSPSQYLDSLPAKGIRDKAIDALNIWYEVQPEVATIIKRIVHLLHGASLMLDDIQDSSQLRRGKPATHIVFGPMQTINSAGYRFLDALVEVRKLESQQCMDIFCDELRDLYIGQSHDLSWTCNLVSPTEDEYLAMVDDKTAGLFRMLARMLDAKSNSLAKPDVAVLTRFMTLLGRLFQIRDDYMNLTSEDYTKQKGFCEDLDEGKYSLPLIHALGCKANPKNSTLLRNLLSQRHVAGRMSLEQKMLFLEHLRAQGSLEYTRHALQELQTELKALAEQMGMLKNENLRDLLETLKV